MKRWFAHPWLSGLILVFWLMLQQSVHIAHLFSGALLALGVPWLIDAFLPRQRPARKAGTALRLLGTVLLDILRSNIAVARLTLSPTRQPQPAWVRLPLRLSNPTAVNLLASVITTTPGTVSCVVDPVHGAIWVHALDCSDAAALVAEMDLRYQAPLKEIFE